MDAINISSDLLIGLTLGIGVPLLIWALRVYAMVKQTRDMHLKPDEYGFGSSKIEELIEATIAKQNAQHIEYVGAVKALRYAFKELTHFIKWMVEERTGKEPPPFIRDD